MTTDLNAPAPLPAAADAQTGARHPATFAPATFLLLLVLCTFGAIIGVQLILQLGVTPNTSLIGALVAMLLARVPLAVFARYRSIRRSGPPTACCCRSGSRSCSVAAISSCRC